MRRKTSLGAQEVPKGVVRKLRCAVYTRKSSEEGLDQAFNSLDAQREACEAYVASQRAEGWVLVQGRYDDGGVSGGTLERPALKRLLSDIERGLVDVVVVYKIDRLSRALMDFAKLVELFDAHRDGRRRRAAEAGGAGQPGAGPGGACRSSERSSVTGAAQMLTMRVPLAVRKLRGGRKLMIAPSSPANRGASASDTTLVKHWPGAFRWRMLETGRYSTIDELAAAEKINSSYVSRLLRLTLLAPGLVEAILDGRQPDGMTLPALMEPFPVE